MHLVGSILCMFEDSSVTGGLGLLLPRQFAKNMFGGVCVVYLEV